MIKRSLATISARRGRGENAGSEAIAASRTPPRTPGPAELGEATNPPPSASHRGLVRRTGFSALLCTQFLGAFNDNLYKMIVSMLAVSAALAAGGGSAYLSLAGAVFILPYLLFSGYAGYVADVFDKRSVLIATKAVEIAVMGLALVALLSGRIELSLVMLFLMALQSVFFSPAKYGILPEMLPEADLSRANGHLEMTRCAAIILGTATGGVLLAAWNEQPAYIGLLLIGVACVGTLTSLWITVVPNSGANKSFSANPWVEIASGMRRIARDRILWQPVAGLTYFDFLATLVMLDTLLVGKEVMGLDDLWTGLLGAIAGLGLGLGSFAAGRLSGDRVKLGLVPFGSIGVGLALILLSFSTHSYVQVAAALALLGFSGGLFLVPLNALLQQKAGRREKGRLIATNNFLNMAGVLLASGALWLLRDVFDIQADRILLIAGLFALGATLLAALVVPDYLARATSWVIGRGFHPAGVGAARRSPAESAAFPVRDRGALADSLPAGRIRHYRDFWPFYLREHGKPLTRALHCLGTAVGLVLLGAGLVTADWRLLAGAPVVSYGIVWISHALIERNCPATVKYPHWSLASDLRMFALLLAGRLGRELERHGIV